MTLLCSLPHTAKPWERWQTDGGYQVHYLFRFTVDNKFILYISGFNKMTAQLSTDKVTEQDMEIDNEDDKVPTLSIPNIFEILK